MAYNVIVASIFTHKVGPCCVSLLTECKAWESAVDHHHHPKVVGMWWVYKQDSFADKILLNLGKFGPINWVEEFNRNQWELDMNSGEGIKDNWVGFIIQHYQPAVTRTHTLNIITKSPKRILHLVNLLFCKIKEAACCKVTFLVARKHEPRSTLNGMRLCLWLCSCGSPGRTDM